MKATSETNETNETTPEREFIFPHGLGVAISNTKNLWTAYGHRCTPSKNFSDCSSLFPNSNTDEDSVSAPAVDRQGSLEKEGYPTTCALAADHQPHLEAAKGRLTLSTFPTQLKPASDRMSHSLRVPRAEPSRRTTGSRRIEPFVGK